MKTVSKGIDGFYVIEDSQGALKGVSYEIISNENTPKELSEEKSVQDEVTFTPDNVDKKLQSRVRSKQVLYYPLTHFDIAPSFKLKAYLRNLKKYFENNPEGLIQITGHTADDEGSYFNMLNSKKYAEKVKKYLVREYEINPRNFRSARVGATRPAASSDTDLGRAANRRIVFSFIK